MESCGRLEKEVTGPDMAGEDQRDLGFDNMEDHQKTTSGYRKAAEQVIRLCACAVKKTVPDPELIAALDLDRVYEAASFHMLAAPVGMALESAGCRDPRFEQAVAQAQRRTLLLDRDRAAVLAELERAGIWYMPLKGVIMKDLYPRFGMREMADNDILFDAARAEDVRGIMTGLGFTVEEYDKGAHDIYYKPPVSNFELHRTLFSPYFESEKIRNYYENVKERLIRDTAEGCGYHFSDEDFYLFMMAHEYKHFIGNGTGLRSLLDTWVFLNGRGAGASGQFAACGDAVTREKPGAASDKCSAGLENKKAGTASFDMSYIARETAKMGIADFEATARELALKLFDGGPLTDAQQQMLDQIISDGTYGNTFSGIDKKVTRMGRAGYFFSRLTLPYDAMTDYFPILKKAPVLYPFFWVYRLYKGLTSGRKKALYEIRAVVRGKKSGKAGSEAGREAEADGGTGTGSGGKAAAGRVTGTGSGGKMETIRQDGREAAESVERNDE